MISTTVKISVTGSNHSELLREAEKELSKFFDIPIQDLNKKVPYELIVTEQEDIVDFDDEDLYVALVIAKVKDV